MEARATGSCDLTGRTEGAERKLEMREKDEKRLRNSLGAKCNGYLHHTRSLLELFPKSHLTFQVL